MGDRTGAGIAATWGLRPTPRTGPKAAFSVEQIARAAIGIADRDGLAAVTMEAVARVLGCTKMALYRYVDGKDDLAAVMFDAAMGVPPRTSSARSWQDGLRSWAAELMARYEQHPWALGVPVGGRMMTRNQTLWLEAALVALRRSALSLREKLSLVLVLNGHVVFSAKLRVDAARSRGQEPDPSLQAVIARDDLPEVGQVFASGYLTDGADDLADFRWGVECIIRGAEARTAPSEFDLEDGL